MKYIKFIILLSLFPLQLFAASGVGDNHAPHLDGSILSIFWGSGMNYRMVFMNSQKIKSKIFPAFHWEFLQFYH